MIDGLSGTWLSLEIFVIDPTDDDFFHLLVAVLTVELEQAQVIAVRSFLFGRGGQVCPELRE
jgi:hypothetical protein